MAARALRQRIMTRIFQLRDFPELGRKISSSRYDDRHELVVPPYRIPYRIVDDSVVILSILDARFSSSDRYEDESEPERRR